MNFSKYSGVALLAALIALVLLTADGCGRHGDTETGIAEAEDHSGHNHAPGEHGKPSKSAESEIDWCEEHRVPESECTICNPELASSFRSSGDWCKEHGLPESHCRICNPGIEFAPELAAPSPETQLHDDEIEVSLFFRPNSAECATDGALIQFASVETTERSGISTIRTVATSRKAGIEAPAEIVFDEARQTVVTSTVPALVSRWFANPGDDITVGTSLAILQSPEIAILQAQLLSAEAELRVQEQEFARHSELRMKNLISVSEFEKQAAMRDRAHADFTSAMGLLKSAGMTGGDIEELLNTKEVSSRFILSAPSSGILIERFAMLGHLLEAGGAYAITADPTAMWIEARLTEEQIAHVAVGQSLTYTSDGRGMDRVGGRIIWVSRFLDTHTRTGTVRARVIDPQHRLQAGEIGLVRIDLDAASDVILVPKAAVQWEGCCNVVFVKESADRYHPRKVRFSAGEGPYYQILHGLKPGEEVVVEGSFLLKTELKKTSLGSGCCGLEPTS